VPDELTGLVDRTELLQTLEHDILTAPSVACLFVDIDKMKPLNMCLGRQLGDAVLAEVARRLKVAVGEDALVARFGGDEFVVISTRWSENGAVDIAGGISAMILATPVSTVEEAHRLSADEIELLEQYAFLGIRFFGPFEDGYYAIGALRGTATPNAPAVLPFEGMPVNAAYVSATVGVAYTAGPRAAASRLLEQADLALGEEKRLRSRP
jgi:diguanylate cyclase (GGDEF)-like protein